MTKHLSSARKARRKAGRRSVKNWTAWTAAFGCLPFVCSFFFHLVDSGNVDTPSDLFQRGDALLVAITFFGSGLAELHRLPKAERPDASDSIVPWTVIAAVVSAALFGYMWPRIDGGTITTLQKTMLGWISLTVLVISIGVGLLCSWLASLAQWDAEDAAKGQDPG